MCKVFDAVLSVHIVQWFHSLGLAWRWEVWHSSVVLSNPFNILNTTSDEAIPLVTSLRAPSYLSLPGCIMTS